MAKSPLALMDGPAFFRWMEDAGLALTSSECAKPGDVVVCSQKQNWCDPVTIGKVKFVGKDI